MHAYEDRIKSHENNIMLKTKQNPFLVALRDYMCKYTVILASQYNIFK